MIVNNGYEEVVRRNLCVDLLEMKRVANQFISLRSRWRDCQFYDL